MLETPQPTYLQVKQRVMKTVRVLSGIGNTNELETVGADFILENVSYLKSIL